MIRRDVAPEDLAGHAAAVAPGFTELWIVEDVPYAGGVTQLAAVLDATSSVAPAITVGHGIAPAPFRNPMALAMEWASLCRIHPGRLAGGIGHGLQTWMSDIGEKVASPLALLEETMVATDALLHGRDPQMVGRYRNISGYTLEFPPDPAPRISVGALGPKSLHLSGRVAGGTILSEGLSPESIVAARARIDEGRAAAGRTDDHRLTVFVGFFCGDSSTLGPPPLDSQGEDWAAVGPDAKSVAAQLQQILTAPVDSMILVPFGDDPQTQLQKATAEILPLLL